MAFAATKTIPAVVAMVLALTGQSVFAQQPTPAQTSAIRANCRSDFMANCSGVQPGGRDALECLKRNLGKLSGGCQAAVSAISPAPAAAAAPTPPTAPAASVPVAPVASAPAVPAARQPSAARPAPAAKLAARPPAAAPAAPPAVAAAPAVPTMPPLVLRPMLPRRRLMIMAICRADAEKLCSGQPPIGPAVLDCLAVKAASLSPTCYEALARVSRP